MIIDFDYELTSSVHDHSDFDYEMTSPVHDNSDYEPTSYTHDHSDFYYALTSPMHVGSYFEYALASSVHDHSISLDYKLWSSMCHPCMLEPATLPTD